MIPRELQHQLHLHAAKGGKTARRRQVKRIEQFIAWTGCRDPRQIGKSHVRSYFDAHDFAPSTARDHWYAIRLLWHTLERPKDPPPPP